MHMNRTTQITGLGIVTLALILAGLLATGAAWAQTVAAPHASSSVAVPHTSAAAPRAWATNVIVPQSRAFVSSGPTTTKAIEITSVEAGVVILEQSATTTIDIGLRNLTGSRQEAELLLPVPPGAVVRSFTFEGAAAEPTAELLPKDAAKTAYESIVAKVKDPALLEFAGYNLIRSSVFPLDPRGTQKVRLTYESLLVADGNRIDYELPRSESVDQPIPWKVSVRIKSKRPISTVYSPTHQLEVKRTDENIVSVRLAPDAANQPGSLKLSYLLDTDGVSASLFAYPDGKGGGYFLLLAGVPAAPPDGKGGGYFLLLAGVPAAPPAGKGGPAIKREVMLVLDRSGSMRGEKLDQAREAARQVIAGLDEGEAFNIILYSDTVDLFAPGPVVKSADTARKADEYLRAAQPRGGTNIHDALVEALRSKPADGMLPLVLFLTDGLPTMGQTSEAAIRDVATKSNPYNRRIFTFGVGTDVNAPLLDKVAAETRAVATFVLPKEDVEVKVGQVFKRLVGPILADPDVAVVDAAGKPALGRTTDILPSKVPDLFAGDQLVLTGRYAGDAPLEFRMSGNYLGHTRTFKFHFDLAGATTRNAFVPRLWASRKIAGLLDAISQMGAKTPAEVAAVSQDPRFKELVSEVVNLSTEFGILTEYTAFLARQGTDLTKKDQVLAEAGRNFDTRAVQTRSGMGGVNQMVNGGAMRSQSQLNLDNGYYDQNMNRVSVATVQQVGDLAFYQRGNRWVDSRLVSDAKGQVPVETVVIGSEAFRALTARLAGENRAGAVSLSGEILIQIDGKPILIRAPEAEK
jgi:Ca-activated chloride channel homolog